MGRYPMLKVDQHSCQTKHMLLRPGPAHPDTTDMVSSSGPAQPPKTVCAAVSRRCTAPGSSCHEASSAGAAGARPAVDDARQQDCRARQPAVFRATWRARGCRALLHHRSDKGRQQPARAGAHLLAVLVHSPLQCYFVLTLHQRDQHHQPARAGALDSERGSHASLAMLLPALFKPQ